MRQPPLCPQPRRQSNPPQRRMRPAIHRQAAPGRPNPLNRPDKFLPTRQQIRPGRRNPPDPPVRSRRGRANNRRNRDRQQTVPTGIRTGMPPRRAVRSELRPIPPDRRNGRRVPTDPVTTAARWVPTPSPPPNARRTRQNPHRTERRAPTPKLGQKIAFHIRTIGKTALNHYFCEHSANSLHTANQATNRF